MLSTVILVPAPLEASPAWEYLDGMPFELTRFCSAQLPDGRIFVAMGSSGGISEDTWIYDPMEDDWFEGTYAPSGWWYSSAVAMPNGTVYVFGGMQPGTPDAEYNDQVFIYETAKDTWRTGPTNPLPTYLGGAAALDDKRILVMGGYFEGTRSECYIFDTETERFSEAAEMPIPLAAGSVVVSNGSVFYIGGLFDPPLNVEEVYRYDIAMGKWSLHGTMAEACSFEKAAVGADGMVYLQGGSQGIIYNENPPARARALDLGDMSLHELPLPPEKGAHGGLMISEGRLIMFGGSGDDMVINQEVLSLPLYESSAEIGAISAGPGTSVRVNVSAELFFVGDLSITATAHLMKGGVSYGSCHLSTPSGGFATALLEIPEDAAPGMYEVVITEAHLGVGVECVMQFEPMDLTVTEAPSPTDRIGELEDQLDDLREQLDGKMDAWVGYFILAVVIVALLILVLQMLRRK